LLGVAPSCVRRSTAATESSRLPAIVATHVPNKPNYWDVYSVRAFSGNVIAGW
jgi:hypothetical protein